MSKTQTAVINDMNARRNEGPVKRLVRWLANLFTPNVPVEFDMPEAPPQYADLKFLPQPASMSQKECASLVGHPFFRPIGVPHYNYFWKRDMGGVMYRLYKRAVES